MRFTRHFCGLLSLIFLLACNQAEETPTAIPEPTEPAAALEIATVAAPTERPEPTETSEPPTVEPTATAIPPTETPVPIVSAILVEPQAVDEFGIVTIQQVVSADAGVIALSNQSGVLGWADFEAGINEDVLIEIDPYRATERLTVGLFQGESAAFEFDSAEPILYDGTVVKTEVELTLTFPMSEVEAVDQTLLEDGFLKVASLNMLEDGWIAAYNDADGGWGERVGLQFVAAGEYSEYKLPIHWQIATPILHVALHRDTDRIGRFDYPSSDAAMMVQNAPVESIINVDYPPDIYVLSQPVVSHTITIDRIISNGPGWVAVSQQQLETELPGNIIGFSYLEDGVNEMIEVEMLPNYATPVLYLQLHEDALNLGEFDFPGDDNPIRYLDQPRIFELDAEPGNYLVSEDQFVDTSGDITSISVPLVVADLDIWVVIRLDEEGTLGDVIGSQWVPPGIHRDLEIEIETASVTPILHVVLHIDRDEPQVLDFPEGRDYELQRRRLPIDAPFIVLEE